MNTPAGDPGPAAWPRAALAWLGLLLAGWSVGALVTATHPGFDGALVADLHGARHGALTAVMRGVTFLGSGLWLDAVFAVALVVLAARRRWRAICVLVLASPGTVVMVHIVRALVNRARPAGVHLTGASGASWPSGHASSSTALYGVIVVIALASGVPTTPRSRRALVAGLVAGLAAIGASRVYLGVHYPTDVLAGWAMAGAWLAVVRRTLSCQRGPRHP